MVGNFGCELGSSFRKLCFTIKLRHCHTVSDAAKIFPLWHCHPRLRFIATYPRIATSQQPYRKHELPVNTMTSDQQTQLHIPSEHPSATAYQQRQQQLPHRRLSTSACRSIASVFSTETDQIDAIELKRYTKKPPQVHDDRDNHDGDLQGGQETPDSCSHEYGNTDTGVTTPEPKEFPEEVPRAPPAATSTASSAGYVPSRLSSFWGNNISIIVPCKDARDHLGRQLYSVSLVGCILAQSPSLEI